MGKTREQGERKREGYGSYASEKVKLICFKLFDLIEGFWVFLIYWINCLLPLKAPPSVFLDKQLLYAILK